jgi:hypothetical protein
LKIPKNGAIIDALEEDDDSVSSPESEVVPDYSNGWEYPALMLLLTVSLAASVSNSFPLSGVIASVSGANGFDLGPYFVLWQLTITVLMLFVFYKVGERLDFFRSYRRLTVLAFMGALIGNLPGFYVYQNFFIGGAGWADGFGYVSSYGVVEPSALIDLLTAAVASFMIPLAGLALASFRLQLLSSEAVTDGDPKASYVPMWPFAVSFALVAAALPVGSLVRALFVRGPPFPSNPFRDFLNELIPGYTAFLVYPVLLLLAFYLMGRRLDLGDWGLRRFRRFALSVFAGAVVGLFVGDVVSQLISGSAMSRLFDAYDLERLGTDLLSAGVMVAILAFAAASLGYFSSQSHTPRTPESTEAQ